MSGGNDLGAGEGSDGDGVMVEVVDLARQSGGGMEDGLLCGGFERAFRYGGGVRHGEVDYTMLEALLLTPRRS
jgi:hypothetical protein